MVIRKEHIVAEIRRIAQENDGRPPGSKRFASYTGIRDHEWQKYWARWSDATQEAGFEPNQWVERLADDDVLARLVEEVRRIGRLPTDRELELRHHQDATFPSWHVFRRLGVKRDRARKLVAYCRAHSDLNDVLAIVEPLITTEEETTPRQEAVEFGFVYLLKSGRYYKLGRTNSVGRRERELQIQLPERPLRVHEIKTDDPAGIEAYWHRRFAGRRKDGEWFDLKPEDIQAFRRRKYM